MLEGGKKVPKACQEEKAESPRAIQKCISELSLWPFSEAIHSSAEAVHTLFNNAIKLADNFHSLQISMQFTPCARRPLILLFSGLEFICQEWCALREAVQ